jgi:adenylate cyclase
LRSRDREWAGVGGSGCYCLRSGRWEQVVRSGRSAAAACAAALQATLEADACLQQWNEERSRRGLLSLEHGFGLHVGAAEYGNIGSSTRLDFTVIGRDVNKASRVEGMCGKLGRRMIASREFVDQVGGTSFHSLGEHPLKGVAGSQELFAVKEP